MDWSIVHSLNGFLFRNDPIEDPLLWYVNAAEALYLLLLVVLVLFARHDRLAPVRRAAVAAGLSAGLGLLTVKIITEFYDRARPFVAHPGAVHLFARHAADASFPSDHATASMAIAVAFLLRRRYFSGVLTIVFAAILDFGRVAAGFHYPTDVPIAKISKPDGTLKRCHAHMPATHSPSSCSTEACQLIASRSCWDTAASR